MKQQILSEFHQFFTIEHLYEQPTLCRATISVSKDLVDVFFRESLHVLKGSVQAYGFSQNTVPLEYVFKQYKANIVEYLKEFFFKFGVVNFLYHEIRSQKLLVAGEPRLVDIFLEHEANARFVFELSVFPSIPLHEWKYFPFKAPSRKNYKDLDRQVEGFIAEEKSRLEKYNASKVIAIGDWVNFDVMVVDSADKPLHEYFNQNFWLKLGDEEISGVMQSLFLGRERGDCFVVHNKGLQDYFSDQLRVSHRFKITIIDVVPYSYFCFEQFKDHFKIKTNKDMHKKLIEVFSYRNDTSQRLSMVEDAFKLLLSKHRFFVPHYLILRQQKIILSAIQKNPDYNVYRKQKDFQFWVRQLSEKQVKESLLIDQLIYHENIHVTHDDIVNYLNFDKRPRMKEFIYFNLPETKRDGQEAPISANALARICAREKAINYVIYHLTKK